MPAGFRRWCSLYHLDGLHFRIRRFLQLQATLAYHPEALSKLHAMDRTCAREKRVITRASREVVFASGGGWSRSRCQNACAVQPERARYMSQSEYAVPLIHSMRPLNRQETHGICKFHDPQFCLRAAFGRATVIHN